MKLLKKDNTYKYYQLSEREMDDQCYYGSDVIAISLEDMKTMKRDDCFNDGYFKECDYTAKKDPHYVIDVYVIDLDSIKIIED